jgi:tetratricopeptide (TPR) repeat protein
MKFDWNCATYAYQKSDFWKACHYLEPWLGSKNILGLALYYFHGQMLYRLGAKTEAAQTIELGKRVYYGTGFDDKYYEKLLGLQLRIAIEQGDEAIACGLENVLRGNKNVDLGQILLGKVIGLRSIGKSEEALAVLKELERHLPEEANYLRGEIYRKDLYGIGMANKALHLFEALGKAESRMGYLGRLRQGEVEHDLGNFSRAKAIYEALMKDVSKASWIRHEDSVRAYLEAKIKQSELAQRCFLQDFH